MKTQIKNHLEEMEEITQIESQIIREEKYKELIYTLLKQLNKTES